MTKTILNLFIFIFFLFPELSYSDELMEYVSPNGEYRAYVQTTKNPRTGNKESEIIIKNKKGGIVITNSYSSPFSSRYGLFVVQADWTADSKFFVYSMFSDLVGHRSWHHPIFFISIDKHEIISLDDIYGPIIYPDFRLSPPHTIHAIVLSGTIMDEYPFEESLSDLMKRR